MLCLQLQQRSLNTRSTAMDPLTNLYAALLQQLSGEPDGATWPTEPPQLEAWMSYWDDSDSEFGNLQKFEHWLSRARRRP
jgi:hypothetical protein